jgi:hypothetical protein
VLPVLRRRRIGTLIEHCKCAPKDTRRLASRYCGLVHRVCV